ncbi:hypothetical protein [Streptomyces hydrogenans]|uniref:hypothetical protein n=1 Tax=Streptomyces hydrogenans TaxID=1873719 RepID=UPI0035DDE7FF
MRTTPVERPTVLRRRSYTWFPVVSGAGFYVAAIALPLEHGDGFASAILLTGISYFCWLIGWNSSFRFTRTHVSVTNVLVTTTADWRDVAGVDIEGGLAGLLRDGRSLDSIAFGGSLIGEFTGYRTHRRACRLLRQGWWGAGPGRRGKGPVPVRTSVEWRRALAIATALYVPVVLVQGLGG